MQGLFTTPKPVIGMVHLLPLPGSPRWSGDLGSVIDQARRDSLSLTEGGVDGLIVENFGDTPFAKGSVGPEVVAAMALVVKAVVDTVSMPVGVNVLRNDAHAALAIACIAGARFIRVNVHTGVMVTDQGIIEGDAAALLRYRRALGAESVQIFADVLVKHAVPLGQQTLEDVARDTAYRGLADALIVSGAATSAAPRWDDVRRVKAAVPDCPVLVGSGVDIMNIEQALAVADGVIIGTGLKVDGIVEAAVDRRRVVELMDKVRSIRPGA